MKAPLIAECYANFDCLLVGTRSARKYGLLVWEVKKAWIDRGRKERRTIHHLGYGRFMVAGRTIQLASRMRQLWTGTGIAPPGRRFCP